MQVESFIKGGLYRPITNATLRFRVENRMVADREGPDHLDLNHNQMLRFSEVVTIGFFEAVKIGCGRRRMRFEIVGGQYNGECVSIGVGLAKRFTTYRPIS